jgi:nitrate reductase alpha subunit
MKTKCYSVRLESMMRISAKCYSARSFDGREALIPASQVYGQDLEVSKSEAWWITAWILEKKNIQYSSKKEAHFYTDTGKRAPDVEIVVHVPEKIEATYIQPDQQLTR